MTTDDLCALRDEIEREAAQYQNSLIRSAFNICLSIVRRAIDARDARSRMQAAPALEREAQWTPAQARLAALLRDVGCDVFAVTFVSGGATVMASIQPEHAESVLSGMGGHA